MQLKKTSQEVPRYQGLKKQGEGGLAKNRHCAVISLMQAECTAHAGSGDNKTSIWGGRGTAYNATVKCTLVAARLSGWCCQAGEAYTHTRGGSHSNSVALHSPLPPRRPQCNSHLLRCAPVITQIKDNLRRATSREVVKCSGHIPQCARVEGCQADSTNLCHHVCRGVCRSCVCACVIWHVAENLCRSLRR